MKIEILYFAVARDLSGSSSATLELTDGADVATALQKLVSRHSALGKIQSSLRLAINEDFVALDHRLRDGDCLALLPPVSGG